MDLYEYQARELFAAHGVPVAAGRIADTPEEAVAAATELGFPAVVKAQVTIGGRGKAGGVKLVHSAQEARDAAKAILGMDIRGHTVERLMVAAGVQIASEQYFSILVDRTERRYLSLFSLRGGMDVEQLAATDPEAIIRTPIDPLTGLTEPAAQQIVRTAGGTEQIAAALAPAMVHLWEVFSQEDASLVEVNPMILDGSGAAVAIDAKVSLDGNAKFRHDWDFWRGAESQGLEARAKALGLNYVKLDGQVGVMGNGAGLVMSTLDLVAFAGKTTGITPANFLDIGGGASADKMAVSLGLVLSDPQVRCVYINVYGGITACDQVVDGILEALDRVDQATLKPIVLRLDGNKAEEGRALLARAQSPWVKSSATMEGGAADVVALASGENN
ncbi:MAG: ADP-forming succinate--CoA ligase subunit beta [Microbacteriaceae bacterium]|nr:ADP-forming succinate--CoA ligase subunit beta [Microbacteriaceae bacterium]MCI1207548.1 ADP-forming succinate--CoA ligase subunit beta [Microbacteriaceae bacterium]